MGRPEKRRRERQRQRQGAGGSEREGGREGGRQRDRGKPEKRLPDARAHTHNTVCVCVCVCVCVRARDCHPCIHYGCRGGGGIAVDSRRYVTNPPPSAPVPSNPPRPLADWLQLTGFS